jgi:hypothetical protein
MSVIDRAQELLALDPLPADCEEQLNALYEQADEIEKTMFGDLFEAMHAASEEAGPPVVIDLA